MTNLQKPFSKEDLLIISAYLEDIDSWDSLVIDRRKPHTHRLSRTDDGIRTCLHMFEPCSEEEAFGHPHAWPARFMCLQGSYLMRSGFYFDREDTSPVLLNTSLLTAGSWYEMTDSALYHKVIPLEPSFTIMQNGKDYTEPYQAVVTTKGKEPKPLDEASKVALLESFSSLIDDYLYAVE